MPRLPPVEKLPRRGCARGSGRASVLGGHLRPVALQLLGDELREAGQRACPSRSGRCGSRRCRRDAQPPRVNFGCGRGLRGGDAGERDVEADDEAAGRGSGGLQEAAARDWRCHHTPPSPTCPRHARAGCRAGALRVAAPATTLIAARTGCSAAAADVGHRRVDLGVGRFGFDSRSAAAA